MSQTFPYQLVGFLDREPNRSESAYNSSRGWFAQIALKRRFSIEDVDERVLMQMIAEFCSLQAPLRVQVGGLVKPERMPVKVLEVEPSKELHDFHKAFIEMLSPHLVSRYPERDGDAYCPHITAEYGDRMVVDVDRYKNKEYVLNKVWLLKDDEGDADSKAYEAFVLGG